MMRELVPADRDHILAFSQATSVFYPHEIDTLAGVIDDYFRESAAYGHVARVLEIASLPVGFVYYAPVAMTDQTWELWWIVVAPAEQGRGTGRALMAAIETDIRRRGGRLLLIETSSLPHYEPTRQFYVKTGFAAVARIPDFYRDGDDKVIYRKHLLSTLRSES